MSIKEQKQIEKEFKSFTEKHFEKPNRCRTLHEVQFYIRELSIKIDEMKSAFNFVPTPAYILLAEYNKLQNKEIYSNFKKFYNWN